MSDNPRKLSWNNRFVQELLQSTDVDCLPLSEQFYFPDDTTPQTLVWEVNQNDFNAVLNALTFGADLAYPETAQNVVLTFLKMVCQNMEICAEIADCITNDETVRESLLQYLSDSGIQPSSGDNPPVPMSAPQTAEQLLPDGYTCDNNHLFGMARWIVQQLDLSTRQVLAAVELLTNEVELAAVFADNVEGVSWFGSGLELAAWVQDQLIEWYDAAYTPTVEDTLACEIFCLITGDCELTLDKIIDAYSNNSFGVPTDINDWLSILDWLFNTTFDGSIGTVASYHYFIAQALRFGSKLPIFDGLRGLKLIVGMGADETDADWDILCSCVTAWCNLFDFTTGQHSFTVDDAGYWGVYVASVGYQMEYGQSGAFWDNRVTPRRQFGVDFTGDTWIVNYVGTAGGASRTLQFVGKNNGSLVFLNNFGAYDVSGTPQSFTYNNTHTVDEVYLSCAANLSGASDPDALTIKSIQIEGTTGEPPETSNC